MTTWQINISAARAGQSVDLVTVLSVCADLVDGIDQENDYDSPFIRVRPADVGAAVERINALGYETDEDE